MKNYKIAAALIGSFVLGAGAASVFAQGTAPSYMVAEINVKDQAVYEASGVVELRDKIKAQGGKLIAGGYNKTEVLDGAPPPNRYLIFQYPDKTTAQKVWSEDIKPWQTSDKVRKVAEFRTWLVEAAAPDMK
jgi:uncharacterized protein (DUF1330 family)